ncbi:MAG: hypothetical protein R6U56_06975 [Opitutales bacterium]
MRQFVDQPSPQKHSWLPVQLWLFLYFAAPLLLFPCVYLSGSWVVEHYYSATSAPAVSTIDGGSGDIMIARYVEALGGDEAIEQLDQVSLICLTLETGPAKSSKLYLDERTMQLIARENRMGGEMVASYRYSNYKSVRGVRLPHTVDAQIEGLAPLQIHYSTLKAAPKAASDHVGEALVLGASRR